MPTKNLTLVELVDRFAHEDECHEYLAELRWPNGIRCPDCDHDGASYKRKRRQYDCNKCRRRFSVRAGTIFNDSHLPLRKWFLAVYIMVQSKKSVSAKQLQRMLGVSYKTAWYLCHRIRKAMADDTGRKLDGIVEVDETFLGGKRESATRMQNKSVVMAAVERGGHVRLRAVPNRRAKHVRKFVEETVSPEAEAAYTDEYRGYDGAFGEVPHDSVRHSPRMTRQPDGTIKNEVEWVHGQVHTNTVEGVFSLLDRSIIGAYHKVSKKHLPRYLHEVEWRYNNRDNPYLFRDTLLELVRCDPLKYKKLTA